MTKFIRHGDVLLNPIKKAKGELVKHNGSFVLAEGETTGHKHVITTPSLDDMEIRKTAEGGYVLTLKSEGTLTHQEHKTLIVPPGTYGVDKEREYDWFSKAVRKVVD